MLGPNVAVLEGAVGDALGFKSAPEETVLMHRKAVGVMDGVGHCG